MAKAAKKPLYNKFITSKEFDTRAKAETWGRKEKQTYKEAGQSVKLDVDRTPNSGWKVSLHAKV